MQLEDLLNYTATTGDLVYIGIVACIFAVLAAW